MNSDHEKQDKWDEEREERIDGVQSRMRVHQIYQMEGSKVRCDPTPNKPLLKEGHFFKE